MSKYDDMVDAWRHLFSIMPTAPSKVGFDQLVLQQLIDDAFYSTNLNPAIYGAKPMAPTRKDALRDYILQRLRDLKPGHTIAFTSQEFIDSGLVPAALTALIDDLDYFQPVVGGLDSVRFRKRPPPFCVLVCGGRNFSDRDFVFKTLDKLHKERFITCLVHGAASGADTLADAWASSANVKDVRRYPAHWEDINAPGAVVATRPNGTQYNKMAGIHRNEKMVLENKINMVVAFRGDRGTEVMKQIAAKNDIPIAELE